MRCTVKDLALWLFFKAFPYLKQKANRLLDEPPKEYKSTPPYKANTVPCTKSTFLRLICLSCSNNLISSIPELEKLQNNLQLFEMVVAGCSPSTKTAMCIIMTTESWMWVVTLSFYFMSLAFNLLSSSLLSVLNVRAAPMCRARMWLNWSKQTALSSRFDWRAAVPKDGMVTQVRLSFTYSSIPKSSGFTSYFGLGIWLIVTPNNQCVNSSTWSFASSFNLMSLVYWVSPVSKASPTALFEARIVSKGSLYSNYNAVFLIKSAGKKNDPNVKDWFFSKAMMLFFVLHFKMIELSAPLNFFEDSIDFSSKMTPVAFYSDPLDTHLYWSCETWFQQSW